MRASEGARGLKCLGDQPSSCQRPLGRRQAMPSCFLVCLPVVSMTTMCRQTFPSGSLKEEVGKTAERGKQIGVAVGAVAGAAIAVRTALRIRRLFRD